MIRDGGGDGGDTASSNSNAEPRMNDPAADVSGTAGAPNSSPAGRADAAPGAAARRRGREPGHISAICHEIISNRMGLAGTIILAALIITSVATITLIPLETLQEWNNPKSWISHPKTAVPAWVNIGLSEKIPEHLILDEPEVSVSRDGPLEAVTHRFEVPYGYADPPNDFIYGFSAEYEGSPLLQMSVTRPDGMTVQLLSKPLPYADAPAVHTERVFSADGEVKKNVELQMRAAHGAGDHGSGAALSAEDAIFSDAAAGGGALQGTYVFEIRMYSTAGEPEITDSELILGGRAFGLMGTDEMRRDLAVGLLWGTPLALFIGIVVSVASVTAGLLYGVYAGYRGKKTDEAMMRFNDVVYALPALPFLIILSVTISNSILLMVGFLVIFGWVGVAKVARSMSLQIKTRGYVDAAEVMGQRRAVIITRHIVPQLLPYALASIAISVPAAITTEAGLSFLGLGDPSFPTWGQILHDANTFGAAARGLWWWMMPPGVMIALTGLAFVFIGNALDRIANPKLKR